MRLAAGEGLKERLAVKIWGVRPRSIQQLAAGCDVTVELLCRASLLRAYLQERLAKQFLPTAWQHCGACS